MKNTDKQVRYPARWMWILGFWGFGGLSYFQTGDTSKLFMLSFFAFFTYYFINKITKEKHDERMLENHNKAVSRSNKIPLLALFIIGIAPSFSNSVSGEFFIWISAIGIAVYVLTYASFFYYYERYT
ncbi:DUF3796 domain-containing protein [Dysgonomonas sp. Marseille-P4677]|uniref:DUF3796 domain-containing protein n=1 Tax=Dysgonomonas sp. Marseille-P4677 TaxID=2364790 RepID=UPI00191363C8|nr:DUF3796 domain-containing protein [Dysgonomonas sp. Marseille-P4677]MBK5719980.1 DUF3796 domain-containing protein [Dysgonomonas sp. Marseille-P4677]